MAEVLKSQASEELDLPAAKKMKVASKCVLRFAKLSENASDPVRASARAAGVDLCSAYEVTVPARGKALVKTDLQVQVPEGSYGRVAPRSGLAVKNFIDVGAGVVDEDYRGNLGVVLFNHSDEEFKVARGDRIAQFICERIFYPELEKVEKLEETARGEGGFGSTGVKEVPAAEKNGAGETKNGDGASKVDGKNGAASADDGEEKKEKNGTESKKDNGTEAAPVAASA